MIEVSFDTLAKVTGGRLITPDDNEVESINTLVTDSREIEHCLLYTSPSPRDATLSRMPSSA